MPLARLPNFLLLSDQERPAAVELERALRRLGAVLVAARPHAEFAADLQVPASFSGAELRSKLPAGLEPDLAILVEEPGFRLEAPEGLGCPLWLWSEKGLRGPEGERSGPDELAPLSRALGRKHQLHPAKPVQAPLQNDAAPRSFVIAVLDESPASPYNIASLLEDLRSIPGEVITVFNNRAMAEKYRGHPRIDRWAELSDNCGVARAWNIGLNLALGEFVFILNSDLHLGLAGVMALEAALRSQPSAALAGPEGGFCDFARGSDRYRLGAKRLVGPTLVDQVSGFYFALKRSVVSGHGLSFHPDYLPCYMEEWDFALQLRREGFHCLRVPLSDYAHEWGGSTDARVSVPCLGRELKLAEALENSRAQFRRRWSRELGATAPLLCPETA